MHPCLYTEDIVRLICAQVFHDNHPDLVALALTAHHFHPHALDFLWRVQTSLKPLIQCFPSDLWEDRNSEYAQPMGVATMIHCTSTIHLRRPIKPSDWERVNVYSSRIRYLKLGPVPELDASLMKGLQMCLGGRPLLPRLSRLSWKITDDIIFPLIRLFLAPTITTFELWPQGSSGMVELFQELKTTLPNLSQIAIFPLQWTHESEGVVRSVACDTICQWDDLQNVLLLDVDHKSAMHLAQLPNLKRLMLENVQDGDLSPAPFEGMPLDGFSSLTNLVMKSQTITLATNLFRAMSKSSPVERIIVDHTCAPTIQQWTECYEALAGNCCPSFLKIVRISQYWHDAAHTPSSSIGPDILCRLLSFPNITTVVLRNDDGFDIDDNILGLMAVSWPQLECFTLATSDLMSPFTPRATLDSLALFVAHCPHIYHLEYRIDARIPPRSIQQSKNRARNEVLYTLHLLDSPVANPEQVASFLMELFIKLEMICISSPWNEEEGSTCAAWLRVARSMGDFPSLRRTCNEHAQAPILFCRDHLLESYFPSRGFRTMS
ncbi:hypothetical protein C8R44DRAFT_769252 [Mycena epipterygia]|nr:hypothetical protein C8R44DRAFT_769252 [Mycena epipterygia]